MDVPPSAMLRSAQGKNSEEEDNRELFPDPIVDETVDPSPLSLDTDSAKISNYLSLVKKRLSSPKRTILPEYAEPLTRAKAAKALIDAIWQRGHFRLDDLSLSAEWKWNPDNVGNMAAFYASVSALCDYLDYLGVGLDSYTYSENPDKCSLVMKAGVNSSTEAEPPLSDRTEAEADLDMPKQFSDAYSDPLIAEMPFKTANPRIGKTRKCPSSLQGDPSNWLIYIPFDTCPAKMGGSVLSEALSESGGMAPDILDPDYLIDCYEVVRELVEDGIVLSGVTVSEGGLMTALDRLISDKGADIDISEIMKSYGESDMVRVLFSEIPGVLIEVSDYDYDYTDAELLLQDVAYYFLGHPSDKKKGLSISSSDISSISGILESLLRSQTSEGED